MDMNRYEIEERVDQYQDHEILGPATRTLENLMRWTDSHSDGWPYWAKPSRAAKQLTTLIKGGRMSRFDDEREDVTAAAYKKALIPIKAFRTREGADFYIEELGAGPADDVGQLPPGQDPMDLLRRALPMLIRLGDFVGNGDIDPNRTDSIGDRCDLIRDIGAKLAEALPRRHCLRCKTDLTDAMGCYIFVGGKLVDGLLCVEHGANGANNLSHVEYERLIGHGDD